MRLTVWLKAIAGLDGQQQMLILKIVQVRHDRQELGQTWRNKINTWFQAATAHSHLQRRPHLRQLFEGPSQFEESGNFAALWVVLARAPCLYKKRHPWHQFFAAALQKKTLNKRLPPPLLPSRQDEWNSMKNFALLAVFTMASIPSSSIQALSTLRFTSAPQKYTTGLLAQGRDSTNYRLGPQDLFWQWAVTPLQPQTWRRQVNDRL